jgi:DNA-binding NtrC family response regulator
MNTNAEYSVFLVDDDKMFLTSVKNSLRQKFGPRLRISSYSTGEECLQHIFQFHPMDRPPDIVILDYNLKDEDHPDAVNGMKVLKELKYISDDTVVIMLSGQDKMKLANDFIESGAYAYIEKRGNAFLRVQSTIISAMENIKQARENNKNLTLRRNVKRGILITIIVVGFIWYLFALKF